MSNWYINTQVLFKLNDTRTMSSQKIRCG